MSIVHESDDALVMGGDCIELMRSLPNASIDAVVTDPPYGLEFMGKAWDKYTPGDFQHWCEQWAAECFRILKPGGHLLAFGGTRTFHRLTAGIEDAGFEIRDSIAWLYGSGFPKSLDVSKAIDKAAGAIREQVGVYTMPHDSTAPGYAASGGGGYEGGWGEGRAITVATTEAAAKWQGWGTALKPAFEPIVVARKSLSGTVAANVLTHGTGALNIDASRIGHASADDLATSLAKNPGRTDSVTSNVYGAGRPQQVVNTSGRWPANVILDESQAAALDEQTADLKGGTVVNRNNDVTEDKIMSVFGKYKKHTTEDFTYGDSGGASRFFYVAKAPKRERPTYWTKSCNCETVKPWQSTQVDTTASASEDGSSWNRSTSGKKRKGKKFRQDTTSITATETSSTTGSKTFSSSAGLSTNGSTEDASFDTVSGGNLAESVGSSSRSTSKTGTSAPKDGRFTVAADTATSLEWSETSVCEICGAPSRREAHSTVKPLTLMRYLLKLVTPAGGVVLDPFAGSGTTIEAALLEGFRCIGMERETDYHPLILHRIERTEKETAA